MRKRKWIKVLFIAIFSVALIVILCFRKGNFAVNTVFEDDDCITLLTDNMKFVFDTGSDVTLLYTDTIPSSAFFFSNTTATDIYGNKIELKKYLLLGATILDNWMLFQTVIILPESCGIRGCDGILGTDIIKYSNWYIDFKNHEIHNQSFNSDRIADLILPYREKGNRWFVDLYLDSVLLKDVLLDTGYTRSDFILSKSSENNLRMEFLQEDTCYNFSNIPYKIDLYALRYCSVNDIRINGITVSLSGENSVIGLPFFKRFSSIYIDTSKKTIFCYY